MSHGDGTAIAWAALVAFFVGVAYVIATQGNEVHDRRRPLRRYMQRTTRSMRALAAGFASVGHAMPRSVQAATALGEAIRAHQAAARAEALAEYRRRQEALSKSPANISGGAPEPEHPPLCAIWVELDDVEAAVHPVGNCDCGISGPRDPLHDRRLSESLPIISGGASEADRVRAHHAADPTMSNEDFGLLVEEAEERDRDREAILESIVLDGCEAHPGDPRYLCEACWVEP